MFRIVRITGHSMEEAYHDGDFVLTMRSPFSRLFLREGRDVVFHKEPDGLMLKRILCVNENRSVNLTGLNDKSISSELLENIPIEHIRGLVVRRL